MLAFTGTYGYERPANSFEPLLLLIPDSDNTSGGGDGAEMKGMQLLTYGVNNDVRDEKAAEGGEYKQSVLQARLLNNRRFMCICIYSLLYSRLGTRITRIK